MGYFRFHRIMKLLPGVRMNLSKSGPSQSFGVTGARVNIGPRSVRTTVGIPGSGLSHIHQQSWSQAETALPPSSKPLSVPVPALQQNTTFRNAEALANGSIEPDSPHHSAPPKVVGDAEPGPCNPHLYAFGKKWFPTLARSRTNQRLPEWLAEAEQDYRAGNLDQHAYELRRQIILEEMSARARGVRPKPMTRREEEALQREMMAAALADETASRS